MDQRLKINYVIGKSLSSHTVEGRIDLREGTILHPEYEVNILLHFFRHDDEVALYSFKNLFFYNSVYLLRLYGRHERKYKKEKRHHPKRRHQDRDQIILSESGLDVYQWASRWVTENNNTVEQGYLLHAKLQKVIRQVLFLFS